MVPAGSRVIAVVSSGPGNVSRAPFVSVPLLVGQQQGDALAQLQRVGLTVQVFNDYSPDYKQGTVVAQYPAPAASVPAGSGSILMVSSGVAPGTVRVEPLPDVTGSTEAEAVSTLQAAHMSPQVVREPSVTVPPGIVMDQLPSRASLSVEPPAKPLWWLWITIGAVLLAVGLAAFFFLRPADVLVPDVTGSTQTEAAEKLAAVGLKLGSVEETKSKDAEEGTIVEQDPAAGAEAPEGSAVNVVVVAAEPLVAVPDVRSKNQADATRELTAVGLKVATKREPNPTVAKGLVVDQSPSGGQKVPPGTTVELVISDGPATSDVSVPDAVGMTQSDAEDAIKEADLRVMTTEVPSQEDATGTVIEQYPPAGEDVAPGTSVGLLVSSGPSTAELVTVADVTKLTLAQAQQVISDAGLEPLPVVAASDSPANEVVMQLPAAGEKTLPGAGVLLFYSAGP
jgi:beta-lactam-binding protein with PASTA domain